MHGKASSAPRIISAIWRYFFLPSLCLIVRARPFMRFVRASQIIFCLLAIAFSRAATAYMLTAVYLVYYLTLKALRGFRKKDYLVVGLFLLVALSTAASVIVVWPDFLFNLLGKEVTLTGRTGIWWRSLDS